MIEIVINYDPETKEFKAYEPKTDTILVTTSLGETFIKLDEFLKKCGLLTVDILTSHDITYHIDSYTFLAMIENNVSLLKRLNQAPSGFQISSQRFGVTAGSQQSNNQNSSQSKKNYSKRNSGTFSKTAFTNSSRKFGSKY